MKLFCGSSNPKLGQDIANNLGIKLGKIKIKKFANDETYVQFLENIRGEDIFLLQSTVKPINDNQMELLIMIDAAKRASARRITIVVPSYFYARQDRKAAPREPITGRLVADMIMAAGANRILTLDLHSDQTQAFFNIPFDNLPARPLFIKKVAEHCNDTVVVSPDAGAAKRATKISIEMNTGLAIINKVRMRHNEAQAFNIIGEDVNGKDCLIFDDMVDTGGSLCLAADMLTERGAKNVYAFITHGILSGDAIKKIEKCSMKKLFITDSIPLETKSNKIEVVTIAKYLADAIQCINEEKSVSQLFRK